MADKKRLVIIGADAAGMSAASEARRTDPLLQIEAFERSHFVSYSQCGLPYLVGGVVDRWQRLIARSVADFEKRDITVHTGHEVIAIDPEQNLIKVKDTASQSIQRYPYDQLIIATGASPERTKLPGLELDGVFHLDTMEDALLIQQYLAAHDPKQAIIVGGGYIGLEMAENLVKIGIHVSLIQRGPQVFPSADVDVATQLQSELERHGVDLTLCDSVLHACEGQNGRVADVHTSKGEIKTDLVILATGVKPSIGLAQSAAIHIGTTGAIAVDAHLRTNIPNILAAGDCAEHWHRLLNRPAWIPLGTTANKQGRIAGKNAAGGTERFAGIVGTAITRVFDLEVARTGLTEREAQAAGIPTMATVLHSTDYAGYMPGTEQLHVKLVADATGKRLLGGQVIGKRGVDKRIDVLAAALYAGLTLAQLTELDLAYAPPFNSVWDPIQVAATSLLRKF
ncbi:MAG: FAD-dependent oxidoreductase [Herpetosiphon sp.]